MVVYPVFRPRGDGRDALFHGKGGCAECHGANAEGKPGEGAALTAGLHFVATDVDAIATLLRCGLMPATTRTRERMPPRGHQRNLTPSEVRRVAGYVWAISQVRDEPWAGGHAAHPESNETGEAHEHGDAHADGGHVGAMRVRKAQGGDEEHESGAERRVPATAATTLAGCPVGSAARVGGGSGPR